MTRQMREQKRERMSPVKSMLRAARMAHFAAGGTSTTWMNPGTVIQDPKKEASRKACRGRVSAED